MDSTLNGKSIILGITGGIAAYKSCDIVRKLVKQGANVNVIMTRSAQKFITPLTFQILSQNQVYTDMFHYQFDADVQHIELATNAQAILIAPATANTISKIAYGICDELLLSVVCATKAKVIFAPSMNTNMWENPIIQENIQKLKQSRYLFIEPEHGDLACGYQGKGRLPDPEYIINYLKDII